MARSLIGTGARQAHRFCAAKSGQTALTFALAVFPLITVVGAAVDYSRGVATRSNLQQATDATVLAMARSYLAAASTSSSMRTPTQTYLTGVMNSLAPTTATVTVNGRTGTVNAATLDTITLSQNNTEMCIATSMIIPTVMMGIVNTKYIAVSAQACASAANTYEIAMVLDNSYSMSDSVSGTSKMDSLHSAATSLVDILLPDGTSNPSSVISLVPFSTLVNVGTSKTAPFLDTAGKSSIHWQNFNIPSGATYKPASKFDLYTGLNVNWGGCVEDRPAPYTTTDTAASTDVPDTMFVPYLAPDDPGDFNNQSYGDLTWETDSNSKLFLNSYLKDSGGNSAGGVCSASGNASYKTADAAAGNLYPGGGLTMACKYSGATLKSVSQTANTKTGPNLLCTPPPITPLTTDKTVLKTAINDMVPEGTTNLGTGFMWGWRTISPLFNFKTVLNPSIIGPQNPKSYGSSTNTKVVILMTDGYNSWLPVYNGNTPYNPFLSSYEAYGYMANQRLSTYNTTCGGAKGTGFQTNKNTWRCQMDNVLSEACANAKAKKVVIYTVGFSISSDPIDDQGINVLKSCATAPSFYYQAADGAGIVNAFKQIASSIQRLRISS